VSSTPLARHLLRVRDLMDRAYATELDVPALARSAHVSPAHFSREFKATFGETPHRYLLSRRMERAMALLRAGERSVTEVCHDVGFTSLGSFSTQFRRFVGVTPTDYRERTATEDLALVPGCLVKRHTRPQPDRTAVSEKRSTPSTS
jgi:AraC-like DNA-binding protein